MNDLPMYIVFDYDPVEGALLAFAPNRQAARVLGHRNTWLADADYIDVRARRLPDDESTAHLRAAATSSGPHVVEDPPSCANCGQWGAGIVDGECAVCEEG